MLKSYRKNYREVLKDLTGKEFIQIQILLCSNGRNGSSLVRYYRNDVFFPGRLEFISKSISHPGLFLLLINVCSDLKQSIRVKAGVFVAARHCNGSVIGVRTP